MKSAPIPDNDAERLRALDEYAILDTPLEPAFDALTELAAEIVGVPIALVSIVDAQRQWFKSRYGLDAPWTPRDVSFCGHVVAAEVSLVVEDAHQDARFSDNPLVLGAPHVRFYAGVPLRTPDGFVLGTLCTIGHEARQITPHQERLLNHLAGQVVAQLELRRNALRLGVERQALADHLALFHLSPDLMCTWQSSQFRMLNPAWERVLGWKVSELAGQPVTALVHPDDLARTSDQLERLERGEALTPDFENRYRHADGRWVSLAWSVARRGVTCFAVARDITERVAATAALAAERVFLEMALSHLPGMSLVVFGHDLRIERAFGLDQILPEEGGQDLRGQPLDALASPENRALLVGAATRCLAGERSHRELSGRGRRLELAFVPWAERNVKLGMLLVSDITERHAMREQLSRQERLVTIGTLAAGVGHEINNPLAYVVTNIDLVVQDLASFAGGSPSARMRDILEALAEARQGAHRIAKIVRGLRAFAREDGPAAPIDVHAAIEISRNMAMHELRQKATFITELGEVPPVIGDEARSFKR